MRPGGKRVTTKMQFSQTATTDRVSFTCSKN